MAKKTIEVSLESVALESTGSSRKKQSQHALTAQLIWPRPAIAKKETVLGCDLTAGAADLSAAPWHETILFKEQVEGKFGVQVELSEAVSNEVLESFLRSFSSILLKDVTSLLGKSDLVFGDLLSSLFSTAGKTGGSSKTKAIARGGITLDPADLKEGDTLVVPLVAPRELAETSSVANPADRGTSRKRKILLKKGEPNGSATLRIHIL